MDEKVVESKIKKSRKSIIIEWVTFFAVAFAVFAVIYAVLNFIPPFSTHNHFVIVSGSMQPTINIGDVAFVDTEYDLNNLDIGDIIAFNINIDLSGEKEVVVHYIDDIQVNEFNERVFFTRPEGENADQDYWELTDENIVGKYVFKIAYVGKFLLFLDSAFGKLVLIADIIFIYLIFDILDEEKKKNKHLNKEVIS